MHYAKAIHRLAAYFIDFLITAAIAVITYLIFSFDLIYLFTTKKLDIALLIQFYRSTFIATMLICAYFVLLPVLLEGQTIGKKIFHIKIVNVDGSKTDVMHLFVREIFGKFILNFASVFFSHLISFILMKNRKDCRAIEDMLAGTIVIDIYKRR